MNKFKKLAIAAVSVVMAGTMAMSVTACGGGSNSGTGGGGGGGGGIVDAGGGGSVGNGTEKYDYYGVLNADGSLNYDTYKQRGNVNLNIAIGDSGNYTSTSFYDFQGTVTLPDGVTYDNTVNKIKPAWVQMGKDLNITWNDRWDGSNTATNLPGLETGGKYSDVDIYTTDLTVAVQRKRNNKTNILNLADYLNRMPNFQKFLTENPIVALSLLQSGMNASTGANQEILVAPYFDGYDDIERYCIVRQDWAKNLLNGSKNGSSATYAAECASATAVTAFMGSEDYTVSALKADGSGTQQVKKNYTAALAAVKDDSKDLGIAYNAIAGEAYSGTSGNIIDIMNAALAKNSAATGAQLLNLFRAYIEVAFTKADGSALYTADNRADVFIGYDACWDVDDLVAMLRCVKTNASVIADDELFSGKVGGIAPRDGNADRLSALVSLACQLYGVRGGTSRYEFTYIDSNGDIHDARNDVQFYEAMVKMNDLYKEGLLADYSAGTAFEAASGIGTGKNINEGDEYFMVYDYLQTQTKYGFYAEDSTISGKDAPYGYYFAPVITPVSMWDVDGDGEIAADEYFRFSESWRSTKTSGIAVNGAVAGNAAKLEAVLEFIDYLYSEDGQIVSTFGPQASNAIGDGGFWYNEEATAAQVSAGEYFTYKGVKYAGTKYKKTYTPTVTQSLVDSFKGKVTRNSDWKIGGNYIRAQLSFTDYARYFIGSTLPLGVKNQSFENQLTSNMGKVGAQKVEAALNLDVIKGMSVKIDQSKENYWWFTCVPSGLPLTTAQQSVITENAQLLFQHMTGTANGDRDFLSVMSWIMLRGTSGSYVQQDVNVSFTSVGKLGDDGKFVSGDMFNVTLGNKTFEAAIQQRSLVFSAAWTQVRSYWNYLKPSSK